MPYPLPKDTVAALRRSDNFALYYQRLLEFPDAHARRWSGIVDRKKNAFYNTIVRQAKGIYRLEGPTQAVLTGIHRRRDAILSDYRATYGADAICRSETTAAWRILTGLSTPTVLENGITLHRLYGFPLLKASALKGLTSHYALFHYAEAWGIRPCTPTEHQHRKEARQRTPWQQFEALIERPTPGKEDDHKSIRAAFDTLCNDDMLFEGEDGPGRLRALRDASPDTRAEALADLQATTQPYREAFGTPDQQGNVIFFDLLPRRLMMEGEPIIERDVLTPHYQDYYAGNGNSAPTDDQSPVPVQLLAIRAQTPFIVRLACPSYPRLLQDTVAPWVCHALSEWGIGAKTRTGYGEMEHRPLGL